MDELEEENLVVEKENGLIVNFFDVRLVGRILEKEKFFVFYNIILESLDC